MMMKRRTPFVTHFVALVTLLLSQLTASAQVTQPPIASIKGGRFTTPLSISLTCETPNAVIRFTLDGSEPADTSSIYIAPIQLNSSTPLRAKAFGVTPLTPSQTITHTYLFNVNHTFPIIALSFRNSDFFNADTGMYVQYLQKREVIANVEMFEPNLDTAVFSKVVGTEITGSTSASLPQKSLEIKAKPTLGTPTIPYKLFPNLPYNDYKRFVLRNSGNEWGITMFRDAMVSGLFREINDISDVLQKPATFLQGYRPAVVYFNGQYWGIHNIRERMKNTYIDQHLNLSSAVGLTNYDLSENDGSLFANITGDSIAWYQFLGEMRRSSRRFDTDSAFAWMEQQIDIDNFTDYVLLEVFADNTDWPANNIRRFKERQAGAKWQWITYDLDFTFGLLTSSGFNTNDATQNSLQRALNPPFPGVSTAEILQKCFQNAKFRQKFANRMADFLNTAFTPARVQGRIEGFKNLYAPEIDKHRVRWGTPFPQQWLDNIQKITDFAGNRAGFTYSHFRLLMSELTDTSLVTLNVSPANAGTLKFNTLTLNQNRLPFVGKYFSGIPIPVKAVAAAGYQFVGWSNANLGISDSIQATFAGGVQSLTALFRPISNCTTIDTTRLTGTTCIFDKSGVFITRLVNRLGCDSIVISTISLNPTDTTRLTATTCVAADAGIFTTRLVNRFGCDSLIIMTRTLQALAKPIVTKVNNVLTAPVSTSYQWFFNNAPLIGSVGQNQVAANTGYYQVQITNIDGCTAKSDSVLVTITVFNCPTIGKNFGDPCDDGNAATTNDRVQTDCSCKGTLPISITCPPNLTLTVASTANGGVVNWTRPATTSTCNIVCTTPTIIGFRYMGRLGKKLYYYSTVASTWANAKTACATAGGKLAIITDANQNNALNSWIGTNSTAWIGLSAPISGGNYQWIDGTPLSYTNWASGEPLAGQIARRDFVSLNGFSTRWETNSSTRLRNFLMEKVCSDTAAMTQTTGLVAGSTFPIGTTVVTYKATDACGNQATCSFNVNVVRAAFCTTPINVAIGKTVRQSSNFTTVYTASRAIDGNTAGTPSRTGLNTNAWWEIDLGANHNITDIKLWNKTDINLATPSDYYVFVSPNPFFSTSLTTTLTQSGVNAFYQAAAMARPTTIPITKIGRYVRIQLRQRNFLNMSEVQIFGCVTPTISNIPTASLSKQQKDFLETDVEFSVFPNPTSGDLNLNLQSFEHAATELYIHNFTGTTILHQSLKDTPTELSLQLGSMNLPNGIYTATIVFEGQAYSKRFVLMQ
jgi:CotH kinase protein/Chitobiase/beta-hexosaminidase C-terminal domain/Lectin C-type domain/HYR domain/Secretion system C-terminal sorting domain/F5/8 type C domain